VKADIAVRVGLVDGDAKEIRPGINATSVGSIPFIAYVGVRTTAQGTHRLSSPADKMYLTEQSDKNVPICCDSRPTSNLGGGWPAQDRMWRQIATDPKLHHPDTTPEVCFKRFPVVKEAW